jgi:hypothetical protein
MPLRDVPLDDLSIDDEASFAHVALYAQLKRILKRSNQRFLVPERDGELSWDRAVFLNLTFWNAEHGAELLCEDRIAADVVAHVAWHAVVSTQLSRLISAGPPSADALFFGESIASAFDLYLVGRLLHNAPDSDFITTQVPIMAEAATQAGLAEAEFAALMHDVTQHPERAFEDLRALLFDATKALFRCRDALQAQAQLESFDGHRFEPLLHHYQLSNWILYARAHAAPTTHATAASIIAGLDAGLRNAPDSLAWLAKHWLEAT